MTVSEQLRRIESVCGKCRHYGDEDDVVCMSCLKPELALKALSHHELCQMGANWILCQRAHSHHPWRILIEPGYRKELPDVFAYTKYRSVLIECKATRSDFLRDKRKPFRKDPQQGVGEVRFYLVNEGVATEDEMPEGWYLLTAFDRGTILLPSNYTDLWDYRVHTFDVRNASAEIELMWSWEYRNENKCLPVIEPMDVLASRLSVDGYRQFVREHKEKIVW